MIERHNSQRGWFAYELLEQAKRDNNIILVTADLGFGMWDRFRDELPNQFINCGAAEQVMMGIGVGLSIEGKKPFLYSITPFLLRRPYETLKLYLDGEHRPVRLIGGGRDKDYLHDGPSHDASDVKDLLSTLPNIKQYWPNTLEEILAMVQKMIKENDPSFISLKR